MCYKDISFIVVLFDLWTSCKRLQNSRHICKHGFIFLVLKKAVSLSTFESDLFFRFKDISLTVVSFIMMEEVCYTDFIFAFQI